MSEANDSRRHEDDETVEERTFVHEDDAFHDRTDWFLVGHAILFEVFMAGATAERALLALPVWLLGCVAAWGWLAVSLRQLQNLDAMKRDFEGAVPKYARAQRERRLRDARTSSLVRRMFPSRHATPVFGIILPLACLGAWFASGAIRVCYWCCETEQGFAMHVVAALSCAVLLVAFAHFVWCAVVIHRERQKAFSRERGSQSPT